MNFFVCALARSKTAWLSAFLSQSGRYCFHDGMNGCSSIDEYRDKLGDSGDSSTGLHLFDVNGLFPDSRIVVIEKSKKELDDCVDWCSWNFGLTSTEINRQNDLLMAVNGMRVKQADIFDRMIDIYEFLTEKDWRDEYSNIASLNIQSDPFNIDYESAKRLMNESI